jgi:hypothetical protein
LKWKSQSYLNSFGLHEIETKHASNETHKQLIHILSGNTALSTYLKTDGCQIQWKTIKLNTTNQCFLFPLFQLIYFIVKDIGNSELVSAVDDLLQNTSDLKHFDYNRSESKLKQIINFDSEKIVSETFPSKQGVLFFAQRVIGPKKKQKPHTNDNMDVDATSTPQQTITTRIMEQAMQELHKIYDKRDFFKWVQTQCTSLLRKEENLRLLQRKSDSPVRSRMLR